MPALQPSDYLKDDLKDPVTGEGGWIDLQANSWDDGTAVLFGKLSCEPLPDMLLLVGAQLAEGYATVVEQRKASDYD